MKIIRKRPNVRWHPYPRIKKQYKRKIKTKRLTRLFPFQLQIHLYLTSVRKPNELDSQFNNLNIGQKKQESNVNSDVKSVVIVSAPGTGKTLTSLAHVDKFGWNAIFITPDNVLDQILKELYKHFSNRVLIQRQIHKQADIIVLTFTEFARLSIDQIPNKIFHTVIIDEIHQIRTRDKFIKNINHLKSQFYIGLTGTPGRLLLHKIKWFQNVKIYQNKEIQLTPPQICYHKHDLSATTKQKYNELLDKIDVKVPTMFTYLRKLLSQDRVSYILNTILPQFPSTDRIAIFSEFNETLMSFALQLPRNSFIKVDSTTKKQDRFLLLKRFEKETSFQYFLSSRQICGIGNDLGFIDYDHVCFTILGCKLGLVVFSSHYYEYCIWCCIRYIEFNQWCRCAK